MQVRTILAIAFWSVLGLAVAQMTHTQAARYEYRWNLVAHRAMPVRQRIDQLQRGIQLALNDLSMTNLRTETYTDANGKKVTYKVTPTFGLSRFSAVCLIHNGVVRNSETATMQDVSGGEIEYYAVSALGKALKPGQLTFHKDVGPFAWDAKPAITKRVLEFAGKACSTLATNASYKGKIAGSFAEARPLKLSKPECMSCHRESKLGDPIGILVCVLAKNPK